ncbi:MAG TPA: AAA family ATPase [Ktedonobacteraceae bacterium]|nr:AAA family ATPase [Ktedonobacteraceae bacterium]
MNKTSNRLQQIKEQLEQALLPQDSDAKIKVKRNSLGWLYLHIITSSFEGKSEIEREEQIDAALEKLNLRVGGFPFANYMLHTPQEASEYKPMQAIEVPLWSEVLMAPDPDIPVPLDKHTESKSPFIITFYSFKGGVGRSTALAFVAKTLVTRGYRVVMIDFDLEAPGLSVMFPTETLVPDTYGVVDYLYRRSLALDDNAPEITKCIRRIEISAPGELYLIPAGEYNENEEGYIHQLADLDMRMLYRRDNNAVHQLLDDVKTSLEPDIILLDASTGFTEVGAVALLDQADLGILCFSPATEQSFAGLKWVVKAAKMQRSYRGIPDLRFLLTPMPAVAAIQQQVWIARASEWITNNWEIPPSVTIDELYYQVPYNPHITTLASLASDMPPGILEAYIPLADAITARVPKKRPPIPKLAE